jgi:hypothetical protein
MADTLSRKERVKPTRVRASVITIQTSLKSQILVAQSKSLRSENLQQEALRRMKKQFELKPNDIVYFMDRMWIPNRRDVRRVILDETHKSRYSIHLSVDKMYKDLKEFYWWPRMKQAI